MIALAILVIIVIANYKLFEKAGEEGWKAIIPFYNCWVQFEITWGKDKAPLSLLLLVPFVNVAVSIIATIKLCKSFGQEGGFIVGACLLPFIFLPVMAFGDAQYVGIVGDNGVITDKYGNPVNTASSYEENPAQIEAVEAVSENDETETEAEAVSPEDVTVED